MIKRILVVAVGLFITVGAFAHDLTGKDVVDQGTLMTLSGTLGIDGDEVYLEADGETYLIHIGPEWYAEKIGFADIAETKRTSRAISVRGFVCAEEISPVSISLDGKRYTFRDRDGVPMWAGRGNRRNAVGVEDNS